MTMIDKMIGSISQWLRDNTLGVSGYVGTSGFLAGIGPGASSKLASIMGTIANINIILAMLIAVITLSIKGIDLYRRFKPKEDKDEAE